MRNKMPPVCYQFGWDDTGDLGVWAVDATAPGGERCVEAMVLAYDEYDSNSKPRDPSTWAPTGDYMAPTVERSPEVHAVLAAATAIGCDLFVDVHGDEVQHGGQR